MRTVNVQVLTRVAEDSPIQQLLPVVRLAAQGNGKSLAVCGGAENVEPHQHDYDGCFGGAQDSILFENSQIPAMMKELLAGVSVGVFSLGMEPAEKPGVRAPLLKEILGRLQLALDARKDVSVQISYAVYGVSDTSCIDLLSYSRRELHEVETLKKWTPLSPLDSLQQVADSIDQGYSLPCVILVRLLITPCDDKLPILMSTLALADLGFVSSGSPIEKSFSKLCSAVLNIGQSSGSLATAQKSTQSFHSYTHTSTPSSSFLATLLEPYFFGETLTTIVANLPCLAPPQTIANFLQVLDAFRRIKNRPNAKLQAPEVKELRNLGQAYNALSSEHRSLRDKMKELRKSVRTAEAQRIELLARQEVMGFSNETQKCEYDYRLAKCEMEKIQLHEKIREREIQFVRIEHERLLCLYEMECRQSMLVQLEEGLADSQVQKENVEKALDRKVCDLAQQLKLSQEQLSSLQQEKTDLQDELKHVTEKSSLLAEQIVKIEKEKSGIESDLKNKRHESDAVTTSQSNHLSKLNSDLEAAQNSENSLHKRIRELETSASSNQSMVQDLESKLSTFKMENATLQAKVDLLMAKPHTPEISRTMKEMEQKWQDERDSLHALLKDFRVLIKEKKPITVEAASVPTASTAEPALKKSRKINPSSTAAIRKQPKKINKNASEDEEIHSDVEELNAAPRPITDTTTSRKKRVGAAVLEKEAGSLVDINITDTNSNSSSSKSHPDTANQASQETEIPGTPQKPQRPESISNASSLAQSPTKVWKPSAFIPGLTKKPMTKENYGILSNISFATSGNPQEGAHQRIKLPDRNKPPSEVTRSAEDPPLPKGRRNVDPHVYSTIMSSFNLPGLKK